MNYVSETGQASQNTQKQTVWNNCALMSFIILCRGGPGRMAESALRFTPMIFPSVFGI